MPSLSATGLWLLAATAQAKSVNMPSAHRSAHRSAHLIRDTTFFGLLVPRDVCQETFGPGVQEAICDPSFTSCCVAAEGSSETSCQEFGGSGWCCVGEGDDDDCYVDQKSACGEKGAVQCGNLADGETEACCPESTTCDGLFPASQSNVRCIRDQGGLREAFSESEMETTSTSSQAPTTSKKASTSTTQSTTSEKSPDATAVTTEPITSETSTHSPTETTESSTDESVQTTFTSTDANVDITQTTFPPTTATGDLNGQSIDSSSSSDNGISGGAIGGLVVGSVACVALIGIAVWWIFLRGKRAPQPSIQHFYDQTQLKGSHSYLHGGYSQSYQGSQGSHTPPVPVPNFYPPPPAQATPANPNATVRGPPDEYYWEPRRSQPPAEMDGGPYKS